MPPIKFKMMSMYKVFNSLDINYHCLCAYIVNLLIARNKIAVENDVETAIKMLVLKRSSRKSAMQCEMKNHRMVKISSLILHLQQLDMLKTVSPFAIPNQLKCKVVELN